MKFFIDTGDREEILQASRWGFVDGVTTNPTLIAQTGHSREDVIKDICSLIHGPVSAEVISVDVEGMISEGKELAKIHPNVVVKLPLTEAGIIACQWMSDHDMKTNVTLCFSPNQALLAAKNGATFVSPFIGRLDDIGHDGMNLIREIHAIYTHYAFKTKILAASLRHTTHVRMAALAKADVATMPYQVMKALFQHPLTDKGLAAFLKDQANTSSPLN